MGFLDKLFGKKKQDNNLPEEQSITISEEEIEKEKKEHPFSSEKDAIEIWVKDIHQDLLTCMYLFPYDGGIVRIK